MYTIVKVSRVSKRGTNEGKYTVILNNKFDKEYKTHSIAQGVLTKKGWEVENKIFDLSDGFKNFVGWEVTEVK